MEVRPKDLVQLRTGLRALVVATGTDCLIAWPCGVEVQRVGADVLVDPGGPSRAAHDPRCGVALQACPIAAPDDGAVAALADREIERSGDTWGEGDGDDLDGDPKPGFKRVRGALLQTAFLRGAARGLWLRGTHRRQATKADSKNLSGVSLGEALSPFEDASFALSSTGTLVRQSLLAQAGPRAPAGGGAGTVGGRPVRTRPPAERHVPGGRRQAP